MKISAINLKTAYTSKANSLTYKNATSCYQTSNLETKKENNVAFSGSSNFILKLQAKMLENEASAVHKNASTSRMEGHSLQRYASKIKKESLLIKADGTLLYEDVQKKLDSARKEGFPNKIDKQSNRMITEFYDGDDGQFIMEEYDSNGYTIRKTIIDDNITLVIKFNPSTGKNDAYAFDTLNGELVEFSKGLRIVGDGYRADENFSYFDDELSAYDSKYKLISEGHEISKEHFAFCQSNLDKYCANWKYKKDVFEKSSDYYSFLDGKLLKSSVNQVEYFGQYQKADEEIFFDADGSFTSYLKDACHSKNNNNNSSAKKMFKFDDLGLEKIYINLNCTDKNKISAERMYKCSDDKVKGCAFGYEYHKDGVENFGNYIAIN